VLLSRDLPYAAVDERNSCLDRPVPAEFGDFPAQSGLSKILSVTGKNVI
jgi:hypothetical protein